MMLAGEDLVASLNDQFVTLIVEPLTSVVRNGSSLLQRRVGRDHFAWDQILSDAEMLQRTLSLSAPELVRRHFNYAKAVSLFSHVSPGLSLSLSLSLSLTH
jgi:hypothetical protein